MDLEHIREHALSKPGVSEDFPFDSDTLAFRVGQKIFLLAPLERIPQRFNAKCAPELALELRETYASITPGYHMNKRHWNTIELNGSIPNPKLIELVDHSYVLVFASLPRKIRLEIEAQITT